MGAVALPPALAAAGQQDFAAGMMQSTAWHQVSSRAAWDIIDGLIDNSGMPRRRGGTSRLSTVMPTSPDSREAVALSFSNGKVVFAGVTRPYVYDVAGATWYLLDGVISVLGQRQWVQQGDFAWAATLGGVIIYAGAKPGATKRYSTGTVTATLASNVLVGAGTTWTTNVVVGMLVTFERPAGDFSSAYRVVEVTDNTHVKLDRPVSTADGSSLAGAAYEMSSFYGGTGLGAGTPVAASITSHATTVAVVGDKLCLGGATYAGSTTYPRRMYVSRGRDPDTGQLRSMEVDDDAYLEFPGDIIASATLRDRVYVFTQAGVYMVSNLAYDQVDAYGNPQWRQELISRAIVPTSRFAVTLWNDAVVVAARDGIYLMDGVGATQKLSDPMEPLWNAHVAAGRGAVNMAVFRNHLMVPIGAAGSSTSEVWVCRLDRQVQTGSGVVRPWTRWTTGEIVAGNGFTVHDPSGTPKLIAGASSGYLTDCTGCFAESTATDGDGTVAKLFVITGQYEPAGGALAFVKDLTANYTAVALHAYWSRDEMVAGVLPTFTLLSATAPSNLTTGVPYTWAVGADVRRIAFAFVQLAGDTAGQARLRGFSMRFRVRGRAR